ncbi:MAG TPA: IPT/TIG domain-containing protein, partial [Solirubrobacteraceae bacterium]|nr:IPT/TIG domain-containing protein [Solirubrobacteraceae bacterium]
MRTALTNLVTRRRTLVLVLIAALAVSTAAWAYWAANSSGSATGKVGALPAPTLSSAAGGAESAALSWSSVTAPGSGAVKYYVSRDGSTPGGSCPSSSGPAAVTSCTDSGVSPGSHEYTVTAVWHSWSATSSVRSASVSSKPTVASTSPSSRGQGASGQTITVTGSHFLSGAAATFSGTGVTVNSTTFKSSTELTLGVSLTGSATTGARSVTVTNPDGGTGTGTNVFTVNAAPSVESSTPSSRGQGAVGQTVTLKGKNFVNGATASFGTGVTVNSTTFKSSTELSADITVEGTAATGPRAVSVTNPDAGVGTLASAFTVNAAPTVTSISPGSRPQGASSQTVTIKGTGFVSGASSSFGSGVTVSSTTFKSSTELSAKISVESSATTGLRTVTVTNPDAGVGSLANAFTVNAAPNVESVSPSSRAQGASGQTITVKGTGFASGASASFSGSSITVESTTVISSTELTAKISISSFASTGARTVTVTNSDGGTDSLSGAFTVDAPPNVTSVSPSSGDRGGSESVAIKGSGFVSGASSSFGSGVTVNSTTFKSSTELIASITIESGASLGSRTVTETNPDGGSDEGTFTVNAAPTVTSTSPSSRAQGASSQTVAIKGTNFESGTGLAASFSGTGITVNSTSFVSSTEVSANVTILSNASVGTRNVTVTNPDTTSATGAGIFTVSAAPAVTSASPSSRGQGASKQTVAIKGSGFVTGASASFGAGITVESTSFVSSTELSSKISIESAASTGARTVTVTNSDGGVGSLASAFTVNAGPKILTPSSSKKAEITHSTTTEFKVTGSGFVSGATVSISGGFTGISTTFVNSG